MIGDKPIEDRCECAYMSVVRGGAGIGYLPLRERDRTTADLTLGQLAIGSGL
jgi:hypothetical protein